MQSSDDSNARPSLAAQRAKVEAEIQDAWERESLSDLCLIARRLLWASHPVPFAGSFGDVVAAGATVKDWGAVPELTPPSAIAACKWEADDDGVYQTGCGEAFTFIDAGPKENNMKFCCYCGGTMSAPADDTT